MQSHPHNTMTNLYHHHDAYPGATIIFIADNMMLQYISIYSDDHMRDKWYNFCINYCNLACAYLV
jgi:hypothetical protein